MAMKRSAAACTSASTAPQPVASRRASNTVLLILLHPAVLLSLLWNYVLRPQLSSQRFATDIRDLGRLPQRWNTQSINPMLRRICRPSGCARHRTSIGNDVHRALEELGQRSLPPGSVSQPAVELPASAAAVVACRALGILPKQRRNITSQDDREEHLLAK